MLLENPYANRLAGLRQRHRLLLGDPGRVLRLLPGGRVFHRRDLTRIPHYLHYLPGAHSVLDGFGLHLPRPHAVPHGHDRVLPLGHREGPPNGPHRNLRLDVVVELDPQRDRVLDVDPGQTGRGRVRLDQGEDLERRVRRLGQVAPDEGRLRFTLVHLPVPVLVLPGPQFEGARGHVAEREDATAVGEVPVGERVVPMRKTRFDARGGCRVTRHPVLHHTRHNVGHDFRTGGHDQVEGVPQVVTEHVPDDREHRDPVHEVRREPLLQLDGDAIPAVLHPDLARGRRNQDGVVQPTVSGAFADPLAEAKNHLSESGLDDREGVGHRLDDDGREMVLRAAGRGVGPRAGFGRQDHQEPGK